MTPIRIEATILLVVILTSCTASPRPTLEQQLVGMNAQERAELLYSACRTEAHYRSKSLPPDQTPSETENPRYRLYQVCEEMDKLMMGGD